MGEREALIKYECTKCQKWHSDYYDAQLCCAPEPKEIYLCNECKKQHKSADYAVECCADLPELTYKIPDVNGHYAEYIQKFCEINNLTA